jgi:hypothetical protein
MLVYLLLYFSNYQLIQIQTINLQDYNMLNHVQFDFILLSFDISNCLSLEARRVL